MNGIARERTQPTPMGVRFYKGEMPEAELAKVPADQNTRRRIVLMLNEIIVVHPLDYCPPFLEDKSLFDGEMLIEMGLAREVSDNWRYLTDTLKRYDPELLPFFRTYKRLAYNETLDAGELTWALLLIQQRAQECSAWMKKKRHDIWNEHLRDEGIEMTPCVGLGALVHKVNAVVGDVGSKSQAQKIAAIDELIQIVHFDPDCLRQLPTAIQPLISTAILRWLDQLAGLQGKSRYFQDV